MGKRKTATRPKYFIADARPVYAPAVHEDPERLRKRVIWETVEAMQLLIELKLPLPEK